MVKLISEAYSVYQLEVVQHNKVYQRYADDFINSHIYHDAADAWSKNQHNKNIGILKTLLYERYEIVLQYFSKQGLSEDDIEIMTNLLDTTEAAYLTTPLQSESQPISTVEPPAIIPNFECSFDTTSIHLLVRCANGLQIFKEKVTYEDMASLFSCKPVRKLTAANNGFVAVFFKGLSSRGLIVSNWQNVISTHQLILSSSRKTHLTQKSLSCALYQYCDKPWSSKYGLLDKYLDELCKD